MGSLDQRAGHTLDTDAGSAAIPTGDSKGLGREGNGGDGDPLACADGFTVPAGHRAKYDILDTRIGVDSYSTLKTRRGSGYYKVPSLKNVWMRQVLEHNGSVGSLEEWFDSRRPNEDFVGSGFKGLRKARAVKGHPFGLKLPSDEKRALIAFLRTL